MKHNKTLLLAVCLLFSAESFAWGLKDLGSELSVPWTTDARYVLIGGTALTVTILIFEDSISDPFQTKQVRNKTLGRSSKWGDWMGQLVPNLLYSAGMGIGGYYGDSLGYQRASGMLKASAYSSAVTTVIKYTAREPRPIDSNWKNSFPSGHSTTAFAFSGFVAAEHGWAWGLPATLLSSFIGYSRIQDNMHWLHDVTAGATIGWVYGWGMSKYQKAKGSAVSETSFQVFPILDQDIKGLGLVKSF